MLEKYLFILKAIFIYLLLMIGFSCKENKADSSDLHLSNKIKKINIERSDVTQDSIKFGYFGVTGSSPLLVIPFTLESNTSAKL